MVFSARLTVVLVLVGVALAFGHDLAPPAWRGESGTTHQHWRFDADANPSVPEIIGNPYGGATATITTGDYGEGWLYDLGFSEQTGIWDIGGLDGNIVLIIANQEGSLESVDVWLQVTYHKFTGFGDAPTIEVVGANYVDGQALMVEEDPYAPGNGWFLSQSLWRIEGGQPLGPIVLSGAIVGTRIDQIVVDVKSVSTAGCVVDFEELAAFCDEWLQDGEALAADLDGSGRVDAKDFSMFAANWMKACP